MYQEILRSPWQSRLIRHGIAIASVLIATLIRRSLDSILGAQFSFPTLLFAVLLNAWYSGRGPALTAAIAGGFATDYFIVTPRGSLRFADLKQVVELLFYLVTSIGIALLGGLLHEARRRAEASSLELRKTMEKLELRVNEHTAELAAANAALESRVAERAAALEAANKELEAFSYSISHDLRAPLRAIDGYSRIVSEDFAKQLPVEAAEYLDNIRKSVALMGRLIDDLLAFSRLGRQPVRRQTVDNEDLVKTVLADLQNAQPRHRVETHLAKLLPCQADPSLLKQVWINLIGNALKYSARRDPAQLEIGCRTDKNDVIYYVKDNGVGFDMRYAHKLFGVFQRLHRAEDYEGTGVGLAIVKRIIERHGGRVWAESAPDQGTTLFFTIANENAAPQAG